jgi:hypothetical protein
MTEDEPAERLSELPRETKIFLSELTREDIETISAGLPIIRMIIGFGRVTKYLAITAVGVAVGFVMLSESVGKIVAWFKQP